MKAIFVAICMTLAAGFFIAALFIDDLQKKQTRLLYAIFFKLSAIGSTVNAIGTKVGALPLW